MKGEKIGLIIGFLFLLGCDSEAKHSAGIANSESSPPLNLAHIDPLSVDESFYNSKYITDGLIFRTKRSGLRYRVTKLPDQTGLRLQVLNTWTAVGNWYFYTQTQLDQSALFKKGKLKEITSFEGDKKKVFAFPLEEPIDNKGEALKQQEKLRQRMEKPPKMIKVKRRLPRSTRSRTKPEPGFTSHSSEEFKEMNNVERTKAVSESMEHYLRF